MVLNNVQTDPREVILDAVEARVNFRCGARCKDAPSPLWTPVLISSLLLSQVCEETCGAQDCGPMVVVLMSEMPDAVEVRAVLCWTACTLILCAWLCSGPAAPPRAPPLPSHPNPSFPPPLHSSRHHPGGRGAAISPAHDPFRSCPQTRQPLPPEGGKPPP